MKVYKSKIGCIFLALFCLSLLVTVPTFIKSPDFILSILIVLYGLPWSYYALKSTTPGNGVTILLICVAVNVVFLYFLGFVLEIKQKFSEENSRLFRNFIKLIIILLLLLFLFSFYIRFFGRVPLGH